MILVLSQGYPFPYPEGLTQEQVDELAESAPHHTIELPDVKSVEMKFEFTVEFNSQEAAALMALVTGWEFCTPSILLAQTSNKDGYDFPAVIVRNRAFCGIFLKDDNA